MHQRGRDLSGTAFGHLLGGKLWHLWRGRSDLLYRHAVHRGQHDLLGRKLHRLWQRRSGLLRRQYLYPGVDGLQWHRLCSLRWGGSDLLRRQLVQRGRYGVCGRYLSRLWRSWAALLSWQHLLGGGLLRFRHFAVRGFGLDVLRRSDLHRGQLPDLRRTGPGLLPGEHLLRRRLLRRDELQVRSLGPEPVGGQHGMQRGDGGDLWRRGPALLPERGLHGGR